MIGLTPVVGNFYNILPIQRSEMESEKENGSDVTPRTRTFRIPGVSSTEKQMFKRLNIFSQTWLIYHHFEVLLWHKRSLNNNHLSTTTTIFGYRKWSLYTSLTLLLYCQSFWISRLLQKQWPISYKPIKCFIVFVNHSEKSKVNIA